ncbi:MAG: IS630 family transposase [Bacteroidota bacterium]
MIPPEKNAAFVAAMERVLDLYAEPYDPARPVVCLDERPCALVGEGRDVLPMRPGNETRQDHEYVRGGLCCTFLAFEPLRPAEVGGGWRRAWVRPQRRRLEFAEVVHELCTEVYPAAEVVRIVCDNLNTHTEAAFYERYPAAEARALAKRVEFVHTPVHGSWLNVVECEFSALVRQCLGHRRLGSLAALRTEVEAWVSARNAEGATVAWQFTTADARVKLRRLYPSL